MKNYIMKITITMGLMVLSGCASKDDIWKENARDFHRDKMTYCGTAGIQQRMEVDETILILCKDNTFNMVEMD